MGKRKHERAFPSANASITESGSGLDPAQLAETTANALRVALLFEAKLREKIVGAFGQDPGWWKRRVPPKPRSSADERRAKDRESPYAPSLKYHQIYYCYLDDLRAIVISGSNADTFRESIVKDLQPRFDELLSLRNRAAHGRFLTTRESHRVLTLVEELEMLLALSSEIKRLSMEDPAALIANLNTYVCEAFLALRDTDIPAPPAPIDAVLESPALSSVLSESHVASLEALGELLKGLQALRQRPGYRIEVARRCQVADTATLEVASRELMAFLSERL